jgi:photosystem II stability/assembly factor-like uncharacterized protein
MNSIFSKFIPIVLFQLIIFSGVHAQTGECNWTSNIPQGNVLYKIVKVPGSSRIIAVGGSGVLMISEDLGDTWNAEYLHELANTSIYSISFPDSLIGYLAGGGGSLFKSFDGGHTWQNIATPPLSYLFFTSIDTGYASGINGTLLKTVDGGLTWDYISSWAPIGITGLFFNNSNTGYVISEYGDIEKTTDGGLSWINLGGAIPNAIDLKSIYFINDSTGYCAGYIHGLFGEHNVNRILKTIDYGNSWDTTFVDTLLNVDNYTSIYFSSLDTGFVSGRKGVIATYDGGSTWTWTISNNLPNGGFLRDVCSINNNISIAIGDNGIVFKTTDGGLTWLNLYNTDFMNDYQDCWFQNDSTGVAINYQGIIRTTDKGHSWQLQFPAGGSIERDVDFEVVNDSTAYVILYNKLYKTFDRGITWSLINSNFNYRTKLCFLNDTVGFTYRDYYVEKTTDGGLTWNFYSSLPFYNDRNDFLFLNDSVGFLIGAYGPARVSRTINRGQSWTNTDLGTSSGDLLTIAFVNDSVGFV